MKLKLTLKRASGTESDIAVTTDAAATVGDIAARIGAVDPVLSRTPSTARRTLTVADASGRAVLDPDLAVGDAPVASGAVIEVSDADLIVPAPTARPTAALVVIGGPDEGRRFPLSLGTSVLGRTADAADIVVNDPLVSKRHARVDVFARSIRIVDLNSANGIEVDGGLVSRIDLENGATVRVGDTILQAELVAGATDTGPVGPIAFTRSPRVEPRYPGDEFSSPTMPTERDPQPFPWLASLMPAVLGGVFILTGRPLESLIFIAASPIIMVGNWLTTRATNKKKAKLEVEKFQERLDHLNTKLEAERADEESIRRRESPSTAAVLAAGAELGPLLWTRRPEHWQFLSLNFGLGEMDSRNSIEESNDDAALPEFLTLAENLREQFRRVSDVPVAENLHFAGAIGVAGPHAAAADLTRSALVQLVGTHSPAELVVTAVVSASWTVELEWLKWLPHTGSANSPIEVDHLANTPATGERLISALEELIAKRGARQPVDRGAALEERSALLAGASVGENGSDVSAPATVVPAVIVIISEDAPVDRARLVQLSERAADAGIYPIWVASRVQRLPAIARSFVEASDDGTTAQVGLVRLGGELVTVRTEPVDRATALAFARRLAPVSDAGAMSPDASDLPRSISLLTLLGNELAESSAAAIERWQQNDSIHDRSGGPLQRRRAGKLRALVGQSGVDALHLDLRTQGPHALVGGTTGSGKSEFLQAWVLGMAAEYSPDRVTFLFVDYKGGSAFAECVQLPHCVGLVTDLSPHLVRRALTSLRAELHHREHLFNRKKAKDLLDLEKRGDPDSPPALVLVIDEFAALAGEVPEFVDGVVDIAQRGRSLGIHLIMATQRPAGVIKDNLRANTNLRVALRMADESDSMDVVGDKIAGTFDPSIPGRAIAKTGPGRLTPFQSAYAGGWTNDEPVEPSVEVAELRFGGEQVWEVPGAVITEPIEGDQGPNDQARIVANLVAAAAGAAIPAPRRPWLDDLARIYDLTRLRQRTDTELVLGVCDLPEQQRQEEVVFRPDTEGNLIVYGAGGSGKTVTLRTIAAAAGITPRGGPVEVFGLDFATGGLRMLEALPHVGSVVSGDDAERVIRLLRTLRGMLDDRRERYSAVNAGSITDYRRLASAPLEPRIILLIDNYPSFRSEFEIGSTRAAWYGVFLQILAEGRGLGVHVAMTADRPGSVPNAVAAGFQRRIVHRMTDEASYSLLDLPMDVLDATSSPGRALVGEAETQIAIVGGEADVAAQSRALVSLGAAIERSGRAPARQIGTLAAEIDAATVPPTVAGKPVLGIADDTLEPITWEPSGPFLLAGPPASGRTTALAWLVQSLDRGRPGVQRHYFGNAKSRIPGLGGWASASITIDEVAAKAKELSALVAETPASSPIAVVVEGIGDFLSTPADGAIVELIKAIKRTDHVIIAEGETSQWSSSWPLLAEIKAVRTGFLLQPESMEGDTILRTSLPRVSRAEFPVGRGFFIARGRATRVQLPLVPLP